jgi:hypothetical protein
MEERTERTIWIILLAILALVVFWLVLRIWHMWRAAPPPNRPRVVMIYSCAPPFRCLNP